MGNCMGDRQPAKNHSREKNPIKQIIQSWSMNNIKSKWTPDELSIIQNRLPKDDTNFISFDYFKSMFPKLKNYSIGTMQRIYDLFCYEKKSSLSRNQFINVLTILRKTENMKVISNVLFYFYKTDNLLQEKERKLFQAENSDLFIKSSGFQDSKKATFTSFNNDFNLEQDVKQKIDQEGFSRLSFEYDLKKFQKLFSWDLIKEEKKLVNQIAMKKIVRKKGMPVYVIEYKWFVQWKEYAEYTYQVFIEFDLTEYDSSYQLNYSSTKLLRDGNFKNRVSPLRISSAKRPPTRPGPIRNHLLRSGEKENELASNLSEFYNYVCLPEDMWIRLHTIYQGGPTFCRIYPRIYFTLIIKVFVNSQGTFITRKIQEERSQSEEDQLLKFLTKQEQQMAIYVKIPGRNNWEEVMSLKTRVSEKLTSHKNYLAVVPTSAKREFQRLHNVQLINGKRLIKENIKNYGIFLNVYLDGVLSKGQVVFIETSNTVMLEFTDKFGNYTSKTFEINQNILKLNPSDIEDGKEMNQLAGLENTGNTCFINSVLQCIIRTPYFGGYLESQAELASKKEDVLINEIYKIYEQSKTSHSEAIQMFEFKRVFAKHFPYFEGNAQQDSQEFLLCLLTHITNQIKETRREYEERSQIESSIQEESFVRKQVVKFFSGKIQCKTRCQNCGKSSKKIEPFYTYSLSLPRVKEMELVYIFVPRAQDELARIPARYSITLPINVTIGGFKKAVSNHHQIRQCNLIIHTMFNNELIGNLADEPQDLEMSYYSNYDVKIVCYELSSRKTFKFVGFSNYQNQDRIIRIQVRQRVYSEKTKSYKPFFVPFMLDISQKSTWFEVQIILSTTVEGILNHNRLIQKDEKLVRSRNITALSKKNQRASAKFYETEKLLSSITEREEKRKSSNLSMDKKSLLEGCQQKESGFTSENNYSVRFISSEKHVSDNNCLICKREFFHKTIASMTQLGKNLLRSTQGKGTYCQDCSFHGYLFKDENFIKLCQQLVITLDWSSVSFELNLKSDVSFETGKELAAKRKDSLVAVLQSNFENEQKIEMNCEQSKCKHQFAFRSERIVHSPNILLLHLKRFAYENSLLVKLTNNVEYQQGLILPSLQHDRYELYGVVAHFGNGLSGHYISYVKVQEKWFVCNDEKVTLARPGQHVNKDAYLLFYRKVQFDPSLMCLDI